MQREIHRVYNVRAQVYQKILREIKSNIRKLRKLRLPLQKKTIAELKQRRNKSNR